MTDSIFTADYATTCAAAMTDYDTGFTAGRRQFHDDHTAAVTTAETALATVTAQHQSAQFRAAAQRQYEVRSAEQPTYARHFADGFINGYRHGAKTSIGQTVD